MPYNPNEPRDNRGRWTSGATAAERFASVFYPDHPKPGPVGPIGPKGATTLARLPTRKEIIDGLRRAVGGEFSDDEINSIYDQLHDAVTWFEIGALASIKVVGNSLVMNREQLTILARRVADLQPPELAARVQAAISRGIQNGSITIRD